MPNEQRRSQGHVLVAGARARVHSLRYGFLFLPALVAVAIAALAPVLVALDRSDLADELPFGFHAEAEAARTVLATIAGSLITVAGLTFSITIVSLQLVSQQFSPRALRGFLGDRLNQIVVGVFVGTFLYCLLVLRTVEDLGGQSFVPALAVTTAVALALVAIGLLLVFINHMATTIQVSSIAAGIASAAIASLEPLYASTFGTGSDEDPDDLRGGWDREAPRHAVQPPHAGYLRAVAFEELHELVRGEMRAALAAAPGQFVTAEETLLEYWAPERDAEFEATVRKATSVQNERDLHQDADFALRQLADIAVKAMSPGVADPTTATTCIGYIRAILEQLAAIPTPQAVRRYDGGRVTLIAAPRPFGTYVDTAFFEVSRYAAADARVAFTVLTAIAAVAAAARAADFSDRVDLLADAAQDIAQRARSAAETRWDNEQLRHALAAVEEAVGSPVGTR